MHVCVSLGESECGVRQLYADIAAVPKVLQRNSQLQPADSDGLHYGKGRESERSRTVGQHEL